MSRTGSSVRSLSLVLLALGCAADKADTSADGVASGHEPVNMGPLINSGARESEPTFTADGLTMYYNCNDRGAKPGYDICVSHLEAGEWTAPVVVGPPISTDYLDVEPLLSPDGTQLYVMSNRPGGHGSTDIWVSRKTEDGWGEAKNLGPIINSPEADHCIYFSGSDWETAYWTSTRPGGFGGNDIWTATRVDGEWKNPTNLGPDVNSEASEHHSLPSPDGKSLYITSDREGGYGGEDIYVSEVDAGGAWGPLNNLGLTINSETNDRCPAFSPDKTKFYFDSERDGGYGDKDLWWIDYNMVTSTNR